MPPSRPAPIWGGPRERPDVRWELGPVREELSRLAPQVELLENLRFDPGETANDPAFVEKLVNWHDAYVNDAFGVSHRTHASVVGPPHPLPSAAGLLLQREIEVARRLLGTPDRPFVAVVGGAKVADKLGVLKSLLDRVDALVVGGGMAFTFLAAQGHDVGGSARRRATGSTSAASSSASGNQILLPTDIVALEPGAVVRLRLHRGRGPDGGSDIPDGWQGLDIGPETVATYRRVHRRCGHRALERADGCLRGRPVRAGTAGVAARRGRLPGLHRGRGRRQCRRGRRAGPRARQISFISTGGGASLELLEYRRPARPGRAARRRQRTRRPGAERPR